MEIVYFFPFATNSQNEEKQMIARVLPLLLCDLLSSTKRVDARYIYLLDKIDGKNVYKKIEFPITENSFRKIDSLKNIKDGNIFAGNLSYNDSIIKLDWFLYSKIDDKIMHFGEKEFKKDELNIIPSEIINSIINELNLKFDDLTLSELSLPLTTKSKNMEKFLKALDILPSPSIDSKLRKTGYNLLKEALNDDPNFKRAFELLFSTAIFRVKLGEIQEGIEIFNFLLSKSPDNYRVLKVIGETWLRNKEYKKAMEPFKRAFKLDGSDDNLLLKLAWLAEIENNLLYAEELYKEAINRELELEKVYDKLGMILIQLEKFKEAEELYQKAINFNENSGNFYFGMANAIIANDGKRVEEAELILKKGIEKDRDFWGNYYLLSTILTDKGDTKGATEAYDMAWSLNPNLDRSEENIKKFQKGSELIKECKYKEGIELLEEVVTNDERFWEAYFFIGLAYRELMNNEEAINNFTRVLSINPKHGQTHNELTIYYIENKNYKKAISHGEIASELEPESAGFICNLGMAKLYNGETDEAEKLFMKAKFMDPGNKIVENCLQVLSEVRKVVNNDGVFSKIKKFLKK